MDSLPDNCLLHTWQISHQISRCLYHEGRQLRDSTLCNPSLSAASSHLGPPRPTLSINRYVIGCLDCTVGAFHMSIPAEPSLFQYMRSRSSIPSSASSSMDLMVAVSCGLTLQICLIIALSFPCRRWRQGFVTGQVSLAWSIALRTNVLYTRLTYVHMCSYALYNTESYSRFPIFKFLNTNYSVKNVGRVMVLVLCLLSDDASYLYKVS